MRFNLDICGLFRLINLLPIFVLIPACQGDAGILSSARAGTGSGAERWPGQQGSRAAQATGRVAVGTGRAARMKRIDSFSSQEHSHLNLTPTV